MLVEQSVFDRDGRPLGKALTDSMTGEVRFIPRGSDEPLPRRWPSVEACRRAVIRTQGLMKSHSESTFLT